MEMVLLVLVLRIDLRARLDVWGETWTPAKVNSSNFGVVFRCAGGSTGFGDVDTAYVDHVEITINYTAGSSASSNPAFLMFVD